jgi:hypothetical protein
MSVWCGLDFGIQSIDSSGLYSPPSQTFTHWYTIINDYMISLKGSFRQKKNMSLPTFFIFLGKLCAIYQKLKIQNIISSTYFKAHNSSYIMYILEIEFLKT